MNELLQEFLFYLKNTLNYSDTTIDSYGRDVSKFLIFLTSEGIKYSEVNEVVIQNFLACELKNHISKTSCARRISALKAYYQFLKKHGYIEENPFILLDHMKTPKKLPRSLYVDQVEDLLKANSLRKDKMMIRDQAILETLYYTGVRVSELINIQLNDIKFDRRIILVFGKGRKERFVPFTEDCKKTILCYLHTLRDELLKNANERNEYVFLSSQGEKLTPRGVQYILKQVEKKSGMNIGLHPHLLRHSIATRLLENGADLRTIQKILGHASIDSTQIYTHVNKETLKTAYDKNFPKFKKK